jgi:CBS domain containing-hemolysin-like protein
MIYLILILFLVGVCLSAFSSGSETGFYRASRVRLVMDALDGDRISKRLLWLFNNPALFVATSLIGNNVANYLVSMAVVLFTQMFQWNAATVEILAPIAIAPVLFVYGELFPKSVFCLAPNRLLRRVGPLFLFFTIVYAPVAAILWSLARFLEGMVGQSPEKVHLLLARRELQDVLEESQEVGLLHPSQRILGQNFFLVAAKPVGEVCTPLPRVRSLPENTPADEILRVARRHKLSEVLIHAVNRAQPVGYVRTVDLLLLGQTINQKPPLRKLISISRRELFGEALMQMHAHREPVALIVGEYNRPVGLLNMNQLTDPLLQGPLGSLRR